MATMIPEISISEFKKLKVHQLKELKSCEVFADGEYVFTFINPNTPFIRAECEESAMVSNSVGGKNLEEILEVGCAV